MNNALVKAAPLLERLAGLALPFRLLPETSAFLATVLGEALPPEEALARLRAVSSGRRDGRADASDDDSPTQIAASGKRNVIPGLCEIDCDCRILPGETQQEIEALIRAELGGDGYELEWLEQPEGGTRSAVETPLWQAIESFVAEDDPGAAVVPILLPGFTDSTYLRTRFGTVAYGFFPMRAMDPELAATAVHSADERAAVADLELGRAF